MELPRDEVHDALARSISASASCRARERALHAPGQQRLLGHPAVVGRRVEVTADLEWVRVWCEGRLVAEHVRCWARHQTISDPAHLQAAAQLRHQRAALSATSAHRDAEEVQLRLLTDYDAAFGLVDGQGVA